ncbi:hypothetical protein BD626DRAFT_629282 [Schizophyllum amplum]|uniref:Uncharacterized protein n=1 Tax=Schizophyllum amplum TaxID=97359 RepID=A0A550CHP4_9AGAR|nr:hypothetical protein BD626DRAFT_629282 [Auriculariopsis ampla]
MPHGAMRFWRVRSVLASWPSTLTVRVIVELVTGLQTVWHWPKLEKPLYMTCTLGCVVSLNSFVVSRGWQRIDRAWTCATATFDRMRELR